MLDHHATLLSMRNRLLTVDFAGTGSMTLASTVNGFTRASGDFIADDGLAVGMEITPVGFTDNAIGVIKIIEPLKITLRNARPVEVASGSRSLSVRIPLIRGWQNQKVDPNQERWRIEEEYMPGPSEQDTTGEFGRMSHRPLYIIKVFALPDVGQKALYKMADAILGVFPPRFALTLADSTVLRVTSKPGPFRGEVLYDDGDPLIVVTIPLWARTQNTI